MIQYGNLPVNTELQNSRDFVKKIILYKVLIYYIEEFPSIYKFEVTQKPSIVGHNIIETFSYH